MLFSAVFVVAGLVLLRVTVGYVPLTNLSVALILRYVFSSIVLGYKVASGLSFIKSMIVALLSITLNTVVVGVTDAIFAG